MQNNALQDESYGIVTQRSFLNVPVIVDVVYVKVLEACICHSSCIDHFDQLVIFLHA